MSTSKRSPSSEKRRSAHFTSVKIACTPSVKVFLESNYGTPVTLPEKHHLRKLATSQLTKNNTRPDDADYPEYQDQIELSIYHRNFYYDGHSIAEPNVRNFNAAVESYIKDLIHHNLDALLIAQEKVQNWKERYFSLLKELKPGKGQMSRSISDIKKELKEHEMNIKTSIEHVVVQVLKMNMDVLPYDTVKKDYYRYRLRKFDTSLSPVIN